MVKFFIFGSLETESGILPRGVTYRNEAGWLCTYRYSTYGLTVRALIIYVRDENAV